MGKSIVVAVIALVVGAGGGYGFEMMKADELSQKLSAVTQERDQAQQNAARLTKADHDAVKKWGDELGNPKMDPVKVQAMLQSLQQNWPAKQKDIESATHALLADLGILPPEKPAAAPAAPAAPAKK